MRLHAAVFLAVLAPALAGEPERTDNVTERTESTTGHESGERAAGAKIKPDRRFRVPPLKEFVPSEEVSADKPVSFPTDI